MYRITPSWTAYISEDLVEDYNHTEHGVIGDFDIALVNMIGNIKKGMSHDMILYHWDQNRGNDWYTSTRKLENGTHQEYKETVNE